MRWFLKAVLVTFVVWLMLTLFVNAAMSAENCGPREELVTNLLKKYGEQPVGIGLVIGRLTTIEVFAAPSRTFTVVVTQTNKTSCIVAAGTDWHIMAVEAPKEGS